MTILPKDEKTFRIRRGRVNSVDLYEIKDSELDLLEKGSPAEIQLNFAIFLFSIAFSAFVCLTTATITPSVVQTVYVVVVVVGILLGTYLLVSWINTRKSRSGIIQTIRARMTEEGDLADVQDQSQGAEEPND